MGVILIVWIASFAVAVSTSRTYSPQLLVIGGFGGFVLLVILIISFAQLSQAQVEDFLRAQGFSNIASTGSFWAGKQVALPAEIDWLFRTAADIGSTGRVFYAATQTTDFGEIWFIRHTVQHGKHSTTRNIFLKQSSTQWPIVRMHKKGIVDSVKKLFGFSPVLLESEGFNDNVSVHSSHSDFAGLLIGPELQSVCVELKHGDELVIGGGAIALITMTSFSENNLARTLELIEKSCSAIPPELAHWEPSPVQR